jgi:hypothetical protein
MYLLSPLEIITFGAGSQIKFSRVNTVDNN